MANRTTLLKTLRDIEHTLSTPADMLRNIDPGADSNSWVTVAGVQIRVSDLRAVVIAHCKVVQEIRRRRGVSGLDDA